MHIHIYIHIHICAQPAASVFVDVYLGVKTHLCSIHTYPYTSVQNTCSKVHVTLTTEKIHIYIYPHPYTYAYICTRTHMRIHYTIHTLKYWYWDSQFIHKYVRIHINMCINAYIYIYIHIHLYKFIHVYTHTHIHIYTHTHTKCTYERTKNTSETTAPRGCAGSPTWRQEVLPFSLSATIWRGIPFVVISPSTRPWGTTDKRRTTTTNNSSMYCHDSAPSRPHPLICTGEDPIHIVHNPPKLRTWPWPPETRSFSCHFGGFLFFFLPFWPFWRVFIYIYIYIYIHVYIYIYI